MRSAPRLFVRDALQTGAEVRLSPEQSHYLLSVLRMGAGDVVLMFNGRDGEWRGDLSQIGKKQALLVCREQLRRQPPQKDLWLVFAPLKSARLDYLVQKAVEMGASRILPVFTERTQAARFNGDRADANMVEAAEQCEILFVPERAEEQRLTHLLSHWPDERRMIFCDEEADLDGPSRRWLRCPKMSHWRSLLGPRAAFRLPKDQRCWRYRSLRGSRSGRASCGLTLRQLPQWRWCRQ